MKADDATWSRLAVCGTGFQLFDGRPVLELRNCACGSTLARVLCACAPTTAEQVQ